MSEHAIEVRALFKEFRSGFTNLKRVEALRGLDLRVARGELYGFLGPNGAGKSTTIKILNRLILPTSGEGLVFGAALTTREARRRVGYLPENPVFYDYLTGPELLAHYGDLLGLDRTLARRRAGELLERVGLGHAASRRIRGYSKGMVQRLGVAQALLGDPELLILDEPVSGLDPIGRRDIRELLLELKSQGKTIFFSTHIIPDVELICDRVGIILEGRMVREGDISALLSEGVAATEVVVSGLDAARAEGLFPESEVRTVPGALSITVPGGGDVESTLRSLLDANAKVINVQTRRRALEDLFVEQLVAKAEPEAAP